ncbi:MAG: hypothetical protein U0N72_10310 [Dialister invisus]|uniref:hypothetical protein n=1 Tax=Dialister invisus TaxID=218538 RepID=UPI002F931824
MKEDMTVNASAGRTAKFTAAAVELGNYLGSLNLSDCEYSQLCELIIKQVNAGEADAFLYGISVGHALALDADRKTPVN